MKAIDLPIALELAGLAIVIISFGVMVYAVVAKLEKMEACLSRSRIIDDFSRRLMSCGLYGRQVRMGVVLGCLIYPPFWIRHGLLDPTDLAEFPNGLRVLVVLPPVLIVLCVAGSWGTDALFGL